MGSLRLRSPLGPALNALYAAAAAAACVQMAEWILPNNPPPGQVHGPPAAAACQGHA